MAIDPTLRPDGTFDGRVALVTGGSSGIGAATARILASRGASVAINYQNNAARAQQLVDELSAWGTKATAFRADVTDQEECQGLVQDVQAALGPLDVLILNAPGFTGADLRRRPALQSTYPDLEKVVSGQVKAFFHPLSQALPGMTERGRGSIVAVGAAASRRPNPGFLALAMAKAAVEAGVKTVAREVGGSGVRVNGVGPGLILSPNGEAVPEAARQANAQRSALGRNGLPVDVAEVIAFLASDRSSYLTGSYLLVDGGTTML
jgi:3-oxoacyl-[acyl-carrier protein] reductase